MPEKIPIPKKTFGFQHHHSEKVPAMSGSHQHQEVEINFIEHGSITYLFNGTLETVNAGTLAIFWATVPHQLVKVDPLASGFYWFTIPLAWVLQWNLPPAFNKSLLEGRLTIDSKPLSWDPAQVREWASILSKRQPAWKTLVLLEIQARLLRLALRNPARTAAEKKRGGHSGSILKLEEMARIIAEHYVEPLGIDDIARKVGLHPGYAMNLFRKHSGQTILECLTQHRIAHAQRLLVTTDAKVLDIALDSGFGSLSRFYEAFTVACKMTPLQYKRSFME